MTPKTYLTALLKAGQTLQSEEENLAELTQMATEFQDKGLPVLKGLRVV